MSVDNNLSVTDTKLDKQAIISHLKNKVEVCYFDTIDSTNSHAKRNADNFCGTPTLFVANTQTNGRGRLSRSFYSPCDTGLYMSLMLKADDNTEDTVCLTTAASVCVTDALIDLYDLSPKIKWVNDIYIDDKKVCGILCEAVTNPATCKIDSIIIGIGINISTTDFPPELKDIATSLNARVDRNILCARICDNIIDMSHDIASRDFIAKYKARSLVIGKEITYTDNGKVAYATAVDIDNNGSLIIRTDNGIKALSTGEISIRLRK